MHVARTLALALLALFGTAVSSGAQEPYRVGAIFSITGPGSSLGIPERDTASRWASEEEAGAS